MMETGIQPDFITVDGGEGGTGAAPLEFSNSVGMPLRDALAFVYDCLTGFGLTRHIKIIAAGKIATRSEEHTSELQSLLRISYAVFCLKKKKQKSLIRYT